MKEHIWLEKEAPQVSRIILICTGFWPWGKKGGAFTTESGCKVGAALFGLGIRGPKNDLVTERDALLCK